MQGNEQRKRVNVAFVKHYLANRFCDYVLEEPWREDRTRNECFRLSKGRKVLLLKVSDMLLTNYPTEDIRNLLDGWDYKAHPSILVRTYDRQPLDRSQR